MTDVHPSSMSSLDSFDFLGHLDDMLSHLDLSRQGVVDDISLQGEDPLMRSACRLGASIGIPLLSVATAVSTIWNLRTGHSQRLSLDLRKAVHTLSPLMRRWTCINGYQVNAASLLGMDGTVSPLILDLYETRDGRWIAPSLPYIHLRNALLLLLNCPVLATSVIRSQISRSLLAFILYGSALCCCQLSPYHASVTSISARRWAS